MDTNGQTERDACGTCLLEADQTEEDCNPAPSVREEEGGGGSSTIS